MCIMKNSSITRRNFVYGMSATTILTQSCSAADLADKLTLTTKGTEGPFYPDKLPLDTDNDLIIVNNSITEAVGEITHLTGRVLTQAGSPLSDTTVEIWQVDNAGVYMHSKEPHLKKKDSNFQSYGRFLTNRKGEYYFRTIKPVKYSTGISRTPHIHVKVTRKNKHLLTTQLYIKGEARNKTDAIYKRIKDSKSKESVTVEFTPFENHGLKQLTAHFDIVVGFTPKG